MSVGAAPAPTKVLIAGGAYAGLSAALKLLKLCAGETLAIGKDQKGRSDGAPSNDTASEETKGLVSPVEITVVDERDGFYHLIGSPLALSSSSYAHKAWLSATELPALRDPRVRWVHGRVKAIEPTTKTATVTIVDASEDTRLPYDYFVAATGLRRVWPTVPQSLSKAKYLQEARKHIASLHGSQYPVVVVGGGAVGVEVAGELKVTIPELSVVLAHSRGRLLSSEPLPEELAQKTLVVLGQQGVDVRLNHRLDHQREVQDEDGRKAYDVTFSDGSTMRASHVVSAISRPVPTTEYLPKEALDGDGYVKINNHLEFASQIANRDSHFATGDLVAWSGIKRCGAAMYAGAICAHNIHEQMLQASTGKAPKWLEYPEIPPMIALALGKDAVAWSEGEGLHSGHEVMQRFFGDDLGLGICVKIMELDKNFTPSKGVS